MNDLISREEAIEHLKHRLYETELNSKAKYPYYAVIADNRIDVWMNEVPFAQPNPAECWGCNCQKMKRLNEQKTFSEMVHLHDAKTNLCDTISRQEAIEAVEKESRIDGAYGYMDTKSIVDLLNDLPSAQAEIIRCRDCEHWDKTWTNDWSPNYHYCPMIDGVRKGDFYCADGERRIDNA